MDRRARTERDRAPDDLADLRADVARKQRVYYKALDAYLAAAYEGWRTRRSRDEFTRAMRESHDAYRAAQEALLDARRSRGSSTPRLSM